DDGPSVAVRIDGPIDTLVAPALAGHAEAVIREAVSNAVRHSGGSAVTVAIAAGEGLRIDVTDNGTGIPDGVHRRGLANLAERAQSCGGDFCIDAPPGGGTVLHWSAPLSSE